MNNIIQLIAFFLALILLSPILGKYFYRVFTGNNYLLKKVLGPVENLIYRILHIDRNEEMDWKRYLFAVLIFNIAGFMFLFLIQVFQKILPLNPENLGNVSWDLAFNTAVSFITNTNWQSYGGEVTLGYMVQMLGLTVQNFMSAATGIVVALALMRGLTAKTGGWIGSFWVDLTRSVLYVLLPLSIVLTVLLVGQGVVQNFSGYAEAKTLEGTTQVIPMGPAASQIAIKQLGTNGGGFFNANSSHPFENPTPFSNFLQVFAIIIISSSLVFTYAHYMKSKSQAWTIYLVMLLLFAAGLAIALRAEYAFTQVHGLSGSMEGKETRFGVFNSILWSVATTATSNGSVNAMHDSYSPIAGMVMMFNIMLGEVIFGGVGSGLYGMIIFILLTVFIAGLMVGRTPEYLGKKVEAFEMKMAILAIMAPNIVIKLFSGLACIVEPGLAGIKNAGPHGLSEILYAFSSAAGNNGSAFGGLMADSVFYNLLLGLGMLIGRYGIIIPVLAIAGSMSKKKITPVSTGTFRTDNWLFAFLLTGVILIVGGLTFFPPLTLGPIAEHFLIQLGVVF